MTQLLIVTRKMAFKLTRLVKNNRIKNRDFFAGHPFLISSNRFFANTTKMSRALVSGRLFSISIQVRRFSEILEKSAKFQIGAKIRKWFFIDQEVHTEISKFMKDDKTMKIKANFYKSLKIKTNIKLM